MDTPRRQKSEKADKKRLKIPLFGRMLYNKATMMKSTHGTVRCRPEPGKPCGLGGEAPVRASEFPGPSPMASSNGALVKSARRYFA